MSNYCQEHKVCQYVDCWSVKSWIKLMRMSVSDFVFRFFLDVVRRLGRRRRNLARGNLRTPTAWLRRSRFDLQQDRIARSCAQRRVRLSCARWLAFVAKQGTSRPCFRGLGNFCIIWQYDYTVVLCSNPVFWTFGHIGIPRTRLFMSE